MKIKIYLPLLLCIVLCYSCGSGWTEYINVGQFGEPYPFNYVGLMSTSADADSVDVYYSIESGTAKEMQHIKVKPPVIIGGHFTNVIFDSTAMKSGALFRKTETRSIGRRAKINYSENGSHYMKIVNNGRYSVDYFIVGYHPIKQDNLGSVWAGAAHGSAAAPISQVVDMLPEVFYKGGPVKYLLLPNEKRTQDMYKMNTEGSLSNKTDHYRPYYYYKSTDTIVFKDSYNGKNIVNAPWSVNQVMALFRAEYRQSNDTILTIRYHDYYNTPQSTRISTGYVKDYSGYIVNPVKPKYYGIIPSGGEVRSSESIPFITHVNYEYYSDKP